MLKEIFFEDGHSDCSCWSARIDNNPRLKAFYYRYMLLQDSSIAWQKHIPFLLSNGVDIKHFKGLEKNLKNSHMLEKYILDLEELLAIQEPDIFIQASIIRKHAESESSKFYALCKWFLSKEQKKYRATQCDKVSCLPF